jgi:predicted HicB family RNase H-like nuclease
MAKKEKELVGLLIDKDIKEYLEEEAKKQDKSLSEYIREIIYNYIVEKNAVKG